MLIYALKGLHIMKNDFKIAFYLLISLILYAELLPAQNLKVRSVEFPDSVDIGETAVLKGYVVNATNTIFNDQLRLNLDIEDKTPENILLDEEIDQTIDLNHVNIAPNDSVYFEQNINVKTSSFSRGTTDLILIWPQMSSNTPENVARKSDIRLTYVRDANAEVDSTDAFDFLPNYVLDFFNEFFPFLFIEYVEIDDCNFIIKLSTGLEIEFPIFACNEDDDENLNDREIDLSNNFNDDDDDDGGEYNDDDDDYNNFDDNNYHDDDDDGNELNDDDDDFEENEEDNNGNEGEDAELNNDDDFEENEEDTDGNEGDNDGGKGGDDEESNLDFIVNDDYLLNNNDFAVENVRQLNTKYIANIDKIKNNNTEYFTIEQEVEQLVITAVTGFSVNAVRFFSLDGKMLFQQNIEATTSFNLKFSEIVNNKSELMMIQVVGKNIESNTLIQQSQKLFIATY